MGFSLIQACRNTRHFTQHHYSIPWKGESRPLIVPKLLVYTLIHFIHISTIAILLNAKIVPLINEYVYCGIAGVWVFVSGFLTAQLRETIDLPTTN